MKATAKSDTTLILLPVWLFTFTVTIEDGFCFNQEHRLFGSKIVSKTKINQGTAPYR